MYIRSKELLSDYLTLFRKKHFLKVEHISQNIAVPYKISFHKENVYYVPALVKILKYLLKPLQIADLLAGLSSAEGHFESRSSGAAGFFWIKGHFIR